MDRYDQSQEKNQQRQGQENWQTSDGQKGSERNNVDDNENAVANGTQSSAPQPGIATVGNTGAASSD